MCRDPIDAASAIRNDVLADTNVGQPRTGGISSTIEVEGLADGPNGA
jgi:hypothetical protein